jgi:hypothetical protein
MRTLVTGILLAASLYGQYGHQHFSYQEACFKNFGLPYCQGSDFAIKPQPKGKNDPRGVGADFPAANVTAADIVAGAIDWRFADPSADTLVGFHGKTLASEPLARKVIAQLGAHLGLSPTEVDNVLARLSGVQQVAISVGRNQTVVMVTGRGSDSALPALDPGWKVAPVAGNAMLVGPAEAVDLAVQRMAKDDPPSDMMRLAMRRQAYSDFWAAGFAGLASPEAGSTKVKTFAMGVSIRDHLMSELSVEFNEPPDAKALGTWAPQLKSAIDGNVVHVTTTIEPDELQQKLAQIAPRSIGEHLASLVKPTRYLPQHDSAAMSIQAKPVIHGLD